MNVNELSSDKLRLLSALDLFKTEAGTYANGQKFSNDQAFCEAFREGQTVEVEILEISDVIRQGQNNSAGIAKEEGVLKFAVTIKVGDMEPTQGQMHIKDVCVAINNGGKFTAKVGKGTFERKSRSEKNADGTPKMEVNQWVTFSSPLSLTKEQQKEALSKVPQFSGAFEGVI